MAHWNENQFQQDIFSYQGLKYLNNLGLPWLMVIYPQHLYTFKGSTMLCHFKYAMTKS